MSERLYALPRRGITTVYKVGKYTVRQRPHVGVGDAPYLYDILMLGDPSGPPVRTLASRPTEADCALAQHMAPPARLEEIIAKIDRATRAHIRGRVVPEGSSELRAAYRGEHATRVRRGVTA
jgi:hypothetical protein